MPGSTPELAIPYAIPTDQLAEWPSLNQSTSERIEELIKGATGTDEVAISDTEPVQVSANPELWVDLAAVDTGSGAGDPALPAIAGFHQSTDITVTATSRHVEGSPTSRVSITNPHATKRMLVRATLSCWMSVTAITAGGSVYVDIDALSGATSASPIYPGSTVGEHRWDLPSTPASALQSANFGVDFWVNPAVTGTWSVNGAKVGGTFTFAIRGCRLTVTPIRYE